MRPSYFVDRSSVIIGLVFAIIIVLALIIVLTVIFGYIPGNRLETTVDKVTRGVTVELHKFNTNPAVQCLIDCVREGNCLKI